MAKVLILPMNILKFVPMLDKSPLSHVAVNRYHIIVVNRDTLLELEPPDQKYLENLPQEILPSEYQVRDETTFLLISPDTLKQFQQACKALNPPLEILRDHFLLIEDEENDEIELVATDAYNTVRVKQLRRITEWAEKQLSALFEWSSDRMRYVALDLKNLEKLCKSIRQAHKDAAQIVLHIPPTVFLFDDPDEPVRFEVMQKTHPYIVCRGALTTMRKWDANNPERR